MGNLIQIRCPSCGVPFLVPQEDVGKTKYCFWCSDKKKGGQDESKLHTVRKDDMVTDSDERINWGSLGQFDFLDA